MVLFRPRMRNKCAFIDLSSNTYISIPGPAKHTANNVLYLSRGSHFIPAWRLRILVAWFDESTAVRLPLSTSTFTMHLARRSLSFNVECARLQQFNCSLILAAHSYLFPILARKGLRYIDGYVLLVRGQGIFGEVDVSMD